MDGGVLGMAMTTALGHEDVGTGRVLVVGEEPLAGSVTTVLVVVGHCVVAVPTAEEGMRALQGYAFDYLVVDFRLPDLRGDVFYGCARVSQPRLLDRTVFVARDARDHAALLLQCAQCPVLRVPFDARALVAMLGTMTGRRSRW